MNQNHTQQNQRVQKRRGNDQRNQRAARTQCQPSPNRANCEIRQGNQLKQEDHFQSFPPNTVQGRARGDGAASRPGSSPVSRAKPLKTELPVPFDARPDRASNDEQKATGQDEGEDESKSESECESESESDSEFSSAGPKVKRMRISLHERMYNDANAEKTFLKKLLLKGAGLTEQDLDICRHKVEMGKTYKSVFKSVFRPFVEDDEKRRPRKTECSLN